MKRFVTYTVRKLSTDETCVRYPRLRPTATKKYFTTLDAASGSSPIVIIINAKGADFSPLREELISKAPTGKQNNPELEYWDVEKLRKAAQKQFKVVKVQEKFVARYPNFRS